MDVNQWWSWILTFLGVTTFFLAGNKVWWAWYVGIGVQVLWFAYAIVSQQWGFLAGGFFYSWVYIRNTIKWTKEHREEVRRGETDLRGDDGGSD